jgi:serine protease AprX
MGTDSAIIAAIERAIALKATYNIRVINLSLGRPVFESYTKDPLCLAAEKAWLAGIVVVASAGNEGRNNALGTNGYATVNSPGNHPLVITVGAMNGKSTDTRADDVMTSYSSKGPTLVDQVVKPDLVAPGNRIVSLMAPGSAMGSLSITQKVPYAYYQNTTSKAYSTDYYMLSGTSMAAPMVSGAAALLIQKDPTLTPNDVKARLMKTASKTFPSMTVVADPATGESFTIAYDMFTVGAGYVDVWAALNDSSRVPAGATAASPTAVRDANTGRVGVVNSTSAVWGDTAVWGSTAVWGATAVWGSSTWVNGASAVWGDSAVWGESTLSSNSAVWGESSPYSNTAVWGDSAVWSNSLKLSYMALLYGES